MSKRGKLQTTVEYAATRAVLSTLGALPRPLAIAAGRALGRAAYALAGGLRRTGMRNLQLAFSEMSERDRSNILRHSFLSLGRQLGVFSQFPRATAENLRTLVEYDRQGAKHLDEAMSRGKGVIFLTSHLGAWELLSFAHAVFYQPLSFMVRPLDNPKVEDLVERYRTRFGNQPVDKKAAARTAMRLLRDGGTLGILADLNTQPREGVFVPFFGHLACTTAGAAVLALRTDATVFPVCAPWDEKRGRYVFKAHPSSSLCGRATVSAMWKLTLQLYRRHRTPSASLPEQWLWIHKRWKTRPAGELDIYRSRRDDLPPHEFAPRTPNVSPPEG